VRSSQDFLELQRSS